MWWIGNLWLSFSREGIYNKPELVIEYGMDKDALWVKVLRHRYNYRKDIIQTTKARPSQSKHLERDCEQLGRGEIRLNLEKNER